jgi:hypothetical protein
MKFTDDADVVNSKDDERSIESWGEREGVASKHLTFALSRT